MENDRYMYDRYELLVQCPKLFKIIHMGGMSSWIDPILPVVVGKVEPCLMLVEIKGENLSAMKSSVSRKVW